VNSELNALLKDPGIRDFMARQGMSAAGGPPEKLATLLKEELARWSRVVTQAHIKAD
jgi:tripartite-type tricarboxylate transporter receptor subunit TctC